MNTKESNFSQFNIENGPPLDRLLDMFKYSFEKTAVIPATFVIAEGYTCPPGEPGCGFTMLETSNFHIVSISHESGDDHNYLLTGWCRVALGEAKSSSKMENGINVCKAWRELVNASYEAYYNTRSRKGNITFFI